MARFRASPLSDRLPPLRHDGRPGRLGSAVLRLGAAVIGPVERQIRTWRLHMRLEALDDRMLDDIGVRRQDIPRMTAPRRRPKGGPKGRGRTAQ
jgi:uncharacterized protein YjiS (DUF1127 family)